MPDVKGRLSAKEQRFIATMGRTGDQAYAAAKAGYSQPDALGSQLMAKPAIRDAVGALLAQGRTDNAVKAVGLLGKVLDDERYPVQHRVAAAKVALADYREHVRATGGDSKDLADMDGRELRQRIERIQAELAERARPVLDLEAQEQPDTSEEPLFE